MIISLILVRRLWRSWISRIFMGKAYRDYSILRLHVPDSCVISRAISGGYTTFQSTCRMVLHAIPQKLRVPGSGTASVTQTPCMPAVTGCCAHDPWAILSVQLQGQRVCTSAVPQHSQIDEHQGVAVLVSPARQGVQGSVHVLHPNISACALRGLAAAPLANHDLTAQRALPLTVCERVSRCAVCSTCSSPEQS
jgi:hypothetical protein